MADQNHLESLKATTADQPLYVILFAGRDHGEVYKLTLNASEYIAHWLSGEITLVHTLDRSLTPILPVLWYCLHLPRSRFDFAPIGARALKDFQRLNVPHRIALVPVRVDRMLIRGLNDGSPKLIFLHEEVLEEASNLIADFEDVVDVSLISELGEDRLQQHWQELHEVMKPDEPLKVAISRLLRAPSLKASLLPAHFVGRNLRGGSDDAVPNDFATQNEILAYALHCQNVLSLTARLEAAGTTFEDAKRVFEAKLAEERARFRFPVAVGIWGSSPKSASREIEREIRRRGVDLNLTDTSIELCILSFLVAHRALARGGVGFISEKIDDEAFQLLATLEATWANGNPKPRFVWRVLRRIGEVVARSFDRRKDEAIRHASSVAAFCEFPFGLGILTDGEDPLGFAVPIHYRPLLPLTQTLQFELAPISSIYAKIGLRILIAECTPANELVGRLSRTGWEIAAKAVREAPNVECDVIEFVRPDRLREALARGRYDVVMISAHGHFDERSSRTGFFCGDQLVLEEELGELPKIVCLSACQVSPRGSGSVNIGDLFLRRGALVVIGPMVPVDVRHNATLMARFFLNLAETVRGATDMRTLEDVWHHTTATNAINDVLTASPGLATWALTEDVRSGLSVLEQFMRIRSVGRLRKGSIYADTETVLKEMACEQGLEEKFTGWIRSRGYLPESALYVIMGWPDLIVLHDAGFDEIASSNPTVRPQQKGE
ncbi:CHAT domain-containing protein [Candidatus Binatus sp.]|uniref:CHAT domain-containing protein n=1 Tax=Candidatus Binatus sp. TaxID=2811406 RepID=UPI003C329A62